MKWSFWSALRNWSELIESGYQRLTTAPSTSDQHLLEQKYDIAYSYDDPVPNLIRLYLRHKAKHSFILILLNAHIEKKTGEPGDEATSACENLDIVKGLSSYNGCIHVHSNAVSVYVSGQFIHLRTLYRLECLCERIMHASIISKLCREGHLMIVQKHSSCPCRNSLVCGLLERPCSTASLVRWDLSSRQAFLNQFHSMLTQSLSEHGQEG